MAVVFLIRNEYQTYDETDNMIDWWSQDTGWGSMGYATVFTEYDVDDDVLPPKGQWVRFEEMEF